MDARTVTLDRRKPIDAAFLEGMRDRIEIADIIDKLQCHVKDPLVHPLRLTQLKAAEILLRKCIPDLKAVEHTDGPKRELTREQLIERLTDFHGRATPKPEQPGANGTGSVDGATEVQH